MPELICSGCSGHVEYKKGEWRVKCPYCSQWRETGEPKPAVPVQQASPLTAALCEFPSETARTSGFGEDKAATVSGDRSMLHSHRCSRRRCNGIHGNTDIRSV